MGIIRRCIERVPVLSKYSTILYNAPNTFSWGGIGCAAGVGLLVLKLAQKKERREIVKGVIKDIWNTVVLNKEKLPPQKEKRLVAIIDIDEVLMKRKWQWSTLSFIYSPRAYADVFLFHLSGVYEIVGLSDLPPEILEKALKEIDPYGCIAYRVSNPNKRVCPEDIGRESGQTVRVLGRAPEKDIDLCIQESISVPWTEDNTLLSVLDLLLNMQGMHANEIKEVLRSYRGRDFVSAYSSVQEEIYPRRRKWLLFPDTGHTNRIVDEVNKERVREYERVKEYMESRYKGNNE